MSDGVDSAAISVFTFWQAPAVIALGSASLYSDNSFVVRGRREA